MNRQAGQSGRRALGHLRELEEAVRAIESGASTCRPDRYDHRRRGFTVGWDPCSDSPPAHLACGCVHEWLAETADQDLGRSWWAPPLTLLVHLAWRAVEQGSDAVAGVRPVFWIGRSCWPYAHVLVRRPEAGGPAAGCAASSPEVGRSRAPPRTGLDERLLRASIFVDPPDIASGLWAMDLALRGGSVVIADGSNLDMTASRRLQLAAEAGAGLALLARPAGERRRLSAAATRWLVRPVPTTGGERGDPPRPEQRADRAGPRWTVECIRCKGSQPPPENRREWMLEFDRARRVVRLLSPVVDRPAAPAREVA